MRRHELDAQERRYEKDGNEIFELSERHSSSVPNGPDYQSGDPNRSKLKLYRQSTVRPAPEPVRTVMD